MSQILLASIVPTMAFLLEPGRGGEKQGKTLRRSLVNPLNPKIKLSILICCPYSFPTEEVGRSRLLGEVNKMSSKCILFFHGGNSYDLSVLQSIDMTRRNLILMTLRV